MKQAPRVIQELLGLQGDTGPSGPSGPSGPLSYSFIQTNGEITGFTGTVETIITIPSSIDGTPITTVGTYLFRSNNFIESVTINSGITIIKDRAFRNCINLRSIVLPNTLTTIEIRAISGCEKLESISLPASLTTIGQEAFIDNIAIPSLVIPSSVTQIGNYAFSGGVSTNLIFLSKIPTFSQLSLRIGSGSEVSMILTYPGPQDATFEARCRTAGWVGVFATA